MMLFETMMQRPGERAEIAANFAEYMRFDPDADRAQIGRELAAILARRERLEGDAEALAAELAGKGSAAQDFADIPGTETPGPDALAQLERAALDAAAEALAQGERLAADIAALDALFLTICRALGTAGVTLSGGEISALKRQGMPDTLAAELAALRRDKIATIPEAERLGADDAAALYYGLTRQGLISGPCAAFVYYLGKPSNRQAKPAKKALSWTGTPAQFAYFVQRLHEYNAARNRYGAGKNTTALCLAFGIDKETQLNKVNPALTHGYKPKEKDRAGVNAAFNTLPSSKETQ